MKKVIMLSMILVLITQVGCKKDKDKPNEDQKPTTKDMLLGKWQLDKVIDETWTLDGALIDTRTEVGKPGDSSIFKNDNQVFGYEDKNGTVEKDVYPFMIFSDSLISLDEELYMIKKLTATELYLHQVDMDTQHNQKDVVKMYLVR